MKTAVFGLTLLIVLVVIGINVRTVRPIASQEPPEEGSILWYVQQAKAKGQKEITMGPSTVDYGGSSSSTNLRVALSSYDAVIAMPVKQVTLQYLSDNIVTWYKFRNLEELSKTAAATLTEETSALPPEELLPVAKNEFVIAQSGGSLTVADVRVVKPFEYTTFQASEQYVLFIRRSPSGKAEIAGGPIGIFALGKDGSLIPFSKRDHPLMRDLREQYGNSLVSLRAGIKLH